MRKQIGKQLIQGKLGNPKWNSWGIPRIETAVQVWMGEAREGGALPGLETEHDAFLCMTQGGTLPLISLHDNI